MNRLFYMLSLCTVFTACNSYKNIKLYRISPGMTKGEVVTTLGKAPDNIIGSKNYPEGLLEVMQYSRKDAWYGQMQEMYWLYFLNGRLIQWGRPGDWEREADKIYEYRVK